ncbi:MAG: flagellar basal-body rod protein FlgG [Candidatus Dadabacteria bacterium]|nr:MAG: flagellar basal-body rod protein FlgG [Candidatus Dadabacteria bacterium]
MYRSLNIVASGMRAQTELIDVLANNIANVNTPAYRRADIAFEDVGYEHRRVGSGADSRTMDFGMGVRIRDIVRDLGQGELKQTGRALDVAIEGNGYLPVVLSDGSEAYTRAGNLRIDADGNLVTAHGYELSARIRVPDDAIELTIAEDGTVSALRPGDELPEAIGQLDLALFPAADRLEPLGQNLFRATAESGRAWYASPGTDGAGRVMQGSLEGSNVDVVSEVVTMISAQRAYELNTRVMQAVDEMMRQQAQMQ